MLPVSCLCHLGTLPARRSPSHVAPQLWTRASRSKKPLFSFQLAHSAAWRYYEQKADWCRTRPRNFGKVEEIRWRGKGIPMSRRAEKPCKNVSISCGRSSYEASISVKWSHGSLQENFKCHVLHPWPAHPLKAESYFPGRQCGAVGV